MITKRQNDLEKIPISGFSIEIHIRRHFRFSTFLWVLASGPLQLRFSLPAETSSYTTGWRDCWDDYVINFFLIFSLGWFIVTEQRHNTGFNTYGSEVDVLLWRCDQMQSPQLTDWWGGWKGEKIAWKVICEGSLWACYGLRCLFVGCCIACRIQMS